MTTKCSYCGYDLEVHTIYKDEQGLKHIIHPYPRIKKSDNDVSA